MCTNIEHPMQQCLPQIYQPHNINVVSDLLPRCEGCGGTKEGLQRILWHFRNVNVPLDGLDRAHISK